MERLIFGSFQQTLLVRNFAIGRNAILVLAVFLGRYKCLRYFSVDTNAILVLAVFLGRYKCYTCGISR
jgi:hypothetical protein